MDIISINLRADELDEEGMLNRAFNVAVASGESEVPDLSVSVLRRFCIRRSLPTYELANDIMAIYCYYFLSFSIAFNPWMEFRERICSAWWW